MIYQQDNHSLRTRAHRLAETTPSETKLEEVLARMSDPDGLQQSLCLVIYNQVEKFTLADEQSLTIGRSDKQTGFMPDVDLMRYNARKHGVSREHACLYRRGQSLYVMDLGSNNGTFVGGKALLPHHAQMLQHGDVIRLGLLEIQVELP
jgi:pSer/pThr/pTyr-binding forkhead associated (FHA) protein